MKRLKMGTTNQQVQKWGEHTRSILVFVKLISSTLLPTLTLHSETLTVEIPFGCPSKPFQAFLPLQFGFAF